MTSIALLTDHYELTMMRASLHSGTGHRAGVFELFGRRLPEGRRYGVVAGTGRFLDALADFRFGPAEIDALARQNVVDDPTLDYLREYRFSGSAWGYAEGEVYFPGSPLLIVEGTFLEAVVLETLALSMYNHDCAVASAASRMTMAAGGRPCIEMGSRRTHEWAAVAAARAAYICGFDTTSNLEAARRYRIPSAGTSAHSFILLHDSEDDAFTAQFQSLGRDTTILVDTYDVGEAVERAVRIAGPELGAVRLDSGDLVAQAHEVRALLDTLGATSTRIVVTSDLDEYAIAALAAAPVDAYGVGTSLVTGSGAPTASLVYKLVSRADDSGELVPVAKASKDKASVGGRKYALRRLDERGIATAEVVGIGERPYSDANDRELLIELVRGGEVVAAHSVETARERHRASLAELPSKARRLSKGEPVIPTVFVEDERDRHLMIGTPQ